jgi:Na+/H+ antiporter NhaA
VPLFTGVVVSMIWANISEKTFLDVFFTSWGFDIGGHDVNLSFVVNDILMAIHFGLALQEIAVACLPGGAMSPPSKAMNPIIATLGGLFGPIGVFYLLASIFDSGDAFGDMQPADHPLNGGECGAEDVSAAHRRLASSTNGTAIDLAYNWATVSKGWGIVTATDIPLAWVGAEIIFGAGHPAITYLLLLAVVDDFCGVAIIAAFYPDPHHPFAAQWLMLVAAGMLLAYVMRWLNIQRWYLYCLGPGGLSWVGLLYTGIHPALALVPIVPILPYTLKPNQFAGRLRCGHADAEDAGGGNRARYEAERELEAEHACGDAAAPLHHQHLYEAAGSEQAGVHALRSVDMHSEEAANLWQLQQLLQQHLAEKLPTSAAATYAMGAQVESGPLAPPALTAAEQTVAEELWLAKGCQTRADDASVVVESLAVHTEDAADDGMQTLAALAKAWHLTQQSHIVTSLHRSDLFCEMDHSHLEQVGDVTVITAQLSN